MLDTAKRQLRAYVSVAPGDLKVLKVDEEIVIEVIATNHGQTPAHKTWYSGHVGIYRNPLPLDSGISEPEKKDTDTTVLFPGNFVKADARGIDKLTTEDLSALIFTDDFRLYVLGSVYYEDVFGEAHSSQFMASIPSADLQTVVKSGLQGSCVRFINNTEHTTAT